MAASGRQRQSTLQQGDTHKHSPPSGETTMPKTRLFTAALAAALGLSPVLMAGPTTTPPQPGKPASRPAAPAHRPAAPAARPVAPAPRVAPPVHQPTPRQVTQPVHH